MICCYNNNSIIHSIKKQILCTDCLGLGAKSRQSFDSCNNCNGTGAVIQISQLGPGFITQTQRTCEKCNGRGKYINEKDIQKYIEEYEDIYILEEKLDELF